MKIVASALTIGSGGSGGREGPTGQISAGFGSLLSRVLELDPPTGAWRSRPASARASAPSSARPSAAPCWPPRSSTATTSIRTALLPCFIASAVSSVVFGAVEGFTPLFGYVGGYQFSDPAQLALVRHHRPPGRTGRTALRQELLRHGRPLPTLALPRWAAPAIGGLLVGTIALVIPQVLGTGYGWIQRAWAPNC